MVYHCLRIMSSQKKRRKNHFNLCEAVHLAEYNQVKKPFDSRTETNIAPAHRFEITLEPDSFSKEKYANKKEVSFQKLMSSGRFALFQNYQTIVHKEDPSEISTSGFKRFLCSGFPQTTCAENGREKKIGSYHMCYRLDRKLVAIGVLDLLPHAVSSVYLL